MAVVVQKYGGSSVADIERLGKVADQIVATRREGHDVVVVVSAMGKTTDNLLALARQAVEQAPTQGTEPAKRELDMLVSTGERMSMALLSIAIQARGQDAVSFTGSQSGIITNDRHFDARIIEVRPHRIEDELARGRVVIVAGYQGMSYKREITTLGRGGSDTTAVALAAALGAERCEIYSDVDGVYSADPRVVPDSHHMPTLDYETMQELAEAGAKVLNAQAVEWARRNKVTILARRTGDALGHGESRETSVGSDAAANGGRFGVVAVQPVAAVTLPRRALPQFLSAAHVLGLPVADLSALGDFASAWWSLVNVPAWPEVRRELGQQIAPDGVLSDGLGVVSLVGVEAGTHPERVNEALTLCSETAQALFVHPLRVSVLLAPNAVAETARRFHQRFVGSPA